jgi:acyl carrier protein
MKGSLDPALKLRLKTLIVTETDKGVAPDAVTDDEVLFGPQSPLQLDSVDGLQISMALQQHFGVRITDPKDLLRIMRSINTLADHLQPH